LNLASKVILSVNISEKIHLRKYGGFGYRWYTEDVLRALELSLQKVYSVSKDIGSIDGVVNDIIFNNMARKLDWREVAVLAPAVIETLECYICNKIFNVGDDHYEKFSFVYCSSKCLGVHRNNGWKLK
jgi:Vms1-associating treble clef domain